MSQTLKDSSYPGLPTEESILGDSSDPYHAIRNVLVEDGLFDAEDPNLWRIARNPFPLSRDELSFFQDLGHHLLAFYRALNRLYFESVRGHQPPWVHAYLDQGKPEALLSFARMKRFRDLVPGIIRPDVIPTDHGMTITELDSVPGGIGLTGSLGGAYEQQGYQIVGGKDGMVRGFATMIGEFVESSPFPLAIVVSDESASYRSEMQWLANRLTYEGIQATCVHPKDLEFTEEGLFLPEQYPERAVSVVYRFYELFDLKNIPKSELVMYSVKKGKAVVTPPYKPWLEEKSAFALVHHPMLEPYWTKVLSHETFDLLRRLMPQTWVLDPSPIPPTAIIPGLEVNGRAVSSWRDLEVTTQKERQYVIKPSGFSELAWGSRGVFVGHDLPQTEWSAVLQSALDSFPTTPSVLQVFHKGRQCTLEYYDEQGKNWKSMTGRARLSPYYFVHGDQAELGGILATVCPKDKKIIHGMRDAIMAPCMPFQQGTHSS
ncbi:MAG: hypothetical protein R3351_01035 [Nitrospirales bacterium]|nr:hypothetical protein [Nitrospirales bacterium]